MDKGPSATRYFFVEKIGVNILLVSDFVFYIN